ncbi:NAD(P)-binding protein [Atractiella rhizophila]|nr:NAD(P)-binding protein [Atractiella rhizophila]
MGALQRKTVLITGCSEGGLGFELAKAFAQRGSVVFATSRKVESMAGLEELGCHLESLDVTSPESVRKAVENILSHPDSSGRIDVLINNSGVLKIGAFVEFEFEKELRNVLEVNLTGTMRVTHEVLNKTMMKQKGGLIITIGSFVAQLPQVWSSPYSAAKAGVHAWSVALREELRPFGIDVLYVNSGGIRSNMGKKMLSEAIIKDGSPFAAAVLSQIEASESIAKNKATPPEDYANKVVNATFSSAGELKKGSKVNRSLNIGLGASIVDFATSWFSLSFLMSLLAKQAGVPKVDTNKLH